MYRSIKRVLAVRRGGSECSFLAIRQERLPVMLRDKDADIARL
jgi:hypothetical protein